MFSTMRPPGQLAYVTGLQRSLTDTLHIAHCSLVGTGAAAFVTDVASLMPSKSIDPFCHQFPSLDCWSADCKCVCGLPACASRMKLLAETAAAAVKVPSDAAVSLCQSWFSVIGLGPRMWSRPQQPRFPLPLAMLLEKPRPWPSPGKVSGCI